MKNVLEQTDKSVTQVYMEGFESIESSGKICLEDWQILSDNCPNLTRLSLRSIMSHNFCNNLGKCLLPNLKTLEIDCYELEDQDFNKILGNCTNLDNLVVGAFGFRGLSIIENLEYGQLKKLSLVGCEDIEEHYLFRIMEMFKSSLRELKLGCMADEPGHDHLQDMNSHILADVNFALLETLTLGDCKNLKLFLTVMPNLKTLKLLDYYINSKPYYFKLLPKCVPLLKELHIFRDILYVGREYVYFLSELKNLETLVLKDLNYSPEQREEGLITDLVSVIINCPKLKTVIFYDILMMNDDHMFTMISSMSSLRFLKVNRTQDSSSKITGSFVSKCADLDRMEPIKVKLCKEFEVKIDVIPSFLELCTV